MLLSEHPPCGRKINHTPHPRKTGFRLHPQNRIVAIPNRRRSHQHSLSAAVWRIIHTPVLILGVVADIMGEYLNGSAFLRSPDNALSQNVINRFRKQRHNIKPHQKSPSTGVTKTSFLS